MGWLVLSVLGVLLVLQMAALVGIRARKPAPPRTAMGIDSPAPSDDSALRF